jgi:hypothetical protein
MEVLLAGFPDGSVTDYVKAILLPQEIAYKGSYLFAVYFVFSAARPKPPTTFKLIWAIAVYVLLLRVPIYFICYYYKYIVKLDDGIGG